jgi:hypothetical protein
MEEKREGLPGFSNVTIAQLPRRRGSERKKAVQELIRKCDFHYLILQRSVDTDNLYLRQSLLRHTVSTLVLSTYNLGLVSKGSASFDQWLARSKSKLSSVLPAKVVTGLTGKDLTRLVLEATGIKASTARDWVRG